MTRPASTPAAEATARIVVRSYPAADEDLERGVEDARFGRAVLLSARTGPGSGHRFILMASQGGSIRFYDCSTNVC